MIMTYFLPMISMCYTYSRIGLELWGSRAIGEATTVQADSIKSKRKVFFLLKYICFFIIFWEGCKDDDDGCLDIHCLLAPLSHLLHHGKHQSWDKLQPLHTGDILDDLLAGHVQLHVQPHDLLLHEPKVGDKNLLLFLESKYFRFRKGFGKVLSFILWWKNTDPLSNNKCKRDKSSKVNCACWTYKFF